MVLAELTDPTAVTRAMDEFDRIGRDAFLGRYGFKPATSYFIERNGNRYDSKAIVGAAHSYQFPDRGPLRPNEFSGGDATVRRKLEQLGFQVVRVDDLSAPLDLILQQTLELLSNRDRVPDIADRVAELV